jgi:SAM-dependent methyltransferase
MNDATVGTLETLQFVTASATSGRLLEVGCGDGKLAALLIAQGFDVIAVDVDPEAVAAARRRGVDARCSDFAGFDVSPMVVVLFSRSLHHIHNPAAALRRAHGMLSPGGQVLVEDFGRERVSRTAATWLYDAMTLAADLCGTAFTRVEDPLAAWRADHPREHIHSSRVLDAAIRSEFRIVALASAPYLYRYVADLVDTHDLAQGISAAVLGWEARLIERGSLPAVGQRWRAQSS